MEPTTDNLSIDTNINDIANKTITGSLPCADYLSDKTTEKHRSVVYIEYKELNEHYFLLTPLVHMAIHNYNN